MPAARPRMKISYSGHSLTLALSDDAASAVIEGYQITVKPVAPRPDDVQASDGGDASAKEPGRW